MVVRKGNECRRALVSYVINGINVTANKKKKIELEFGESARTITAQHALCFCLDKTKSGECGGILTIGSSLW